MVSFVLNEHLAGATFSDAGLLGYPRVMAVDRRPYRTADGWIAVLPYTGEQWRRFLTEVGRTDVSDEPWFKDARLRQSCIDRLYAVVAEVLPNRTTAEWITALSVRDVPCSEVNLLADLLTDPHLAETGFFAVSPEYPSDIRRSLPQPVDFGGLDSIPDMPPGDLGQDSLAVLQDYGFSDAEIEELVAIGALFMPTDRLTTTSGEPT